MTHIDARLVRELFNCDPSRGSLWWRPRTAGMFTAGQRPCDQPEAKAKRWNKKYAGKPALTATNKNGYCQGSIFGTQISAHTVVWAWVHGEWPKNEIDHINGRRNDNRIENIRDVTHAENTRNAAIPKKNKFGVVGVYYRPGRSERCHVTFRGRHLGVCDTLEEARAMRKAAEREHGFHENHGRASS